MRNIALFAIIVSATIAALVILLAAIEWWLRLHESLNDVLNTAVRDDESLKDVHLINTINKIGGDCGNRWLGD